MDSGILKPLADITDLLKRLAGPSFNELGAIFGDNVKVYRAKNFIRTTEKTKRILEEAGLLANPVPTRLLLPIVDNCSVEDNDELQERWAGLLASASQESDSLSPSFIETLKQLTPKEAKHFDYIICLLSVTYRKELTSHDPIPPGALRENGGAPAGARDTYERLGLIRRDYEVRLESGSIDSTVKPMARVLVEIESALDSMGADIEYQFKFTTYALRFFEACRGPRKKVEPALDS